MNPINEICDEEFVPFLHDLGVETYKKSFEWMLNDPDFAGVLRWLYKNLDHNNALTAREEYRYIELEKKGCLLSAKDLESSLNTIKEEYPGICIPGNHECKEDVELDVGRQKERLNLMERQEMVVKDLIRQNELLKEELTLELTRLSASHHQCKEDEDSLADECTRMAQELETITDEVIEVISENLEVYASCKGDKMDPVPSYMYFCLNAQCSEGLASLAHYVSALEIANRFFTFAPLESYRQTQALFHSHFDLYVSKNLVNRQTDITDEELRTTLLEAKNMEERLSDAAFAYLYSKAELSGEQAKLALVSNYNNVHSSQLTSILVETQSALELLEREENIIEQEMQNSVEQLVKSRTILAVNTAAVAAVSVRQQMLSSLTHLTEVWQQALSLDRLLYLCLRHELRTLEEFLQFATQLSQYVLTENCAIANRIVSMSKICADQESCEMKLQSSNRLLDTLSAMLGEPEGDGPILVKLYNELQINLKELKENADEGVGRKEMALAEMRKSSESLSDHIWDGCTKQPNCWDRTVSALNHTLSHEMGAVDKRVAEASSLFTSVKNGDKQNLRKLWQWFLTDSPRLLAAIKNARCY